MLQEGLVLHIVPELALCDRFEDGKAGAGIRLWEGDVESHDAGPVMLEELANHQRQFVATPGPVALGVQALLVDIDDDESRVAALDQEKAHARVVGPPLELRQCTDFLPPGGVDEKTENQGNPKSCAGEPPKREL